MYHDTRTYALCKSIEHAEFDREVDGCILSTIVEHRETPFWDYPMCRENLTVTPDYSLAVTLLERVLGQANAFLDYVNFVSETGQKYHSASTEHSRKAAEYLVKGFMSTRGIDDTQINSVKFLCARIELFCAEDSINEKLYKLVELETEPPSITSQILSDPIAMANARMLKVFGLLPILASEIFDCGKPSEQSKIGLLHTVCLLQSNNDKLVDPRLQKTVQQTLNKIRNFLT